MGNLERGLDLELDLELTLKLDLELSLQLESFLVQTYHLSAVLEVCILLVAVVHRRNLLLVEVLYWQCSFCLDLWKKTVSVN